MNNDSLNNNTNENKEEVKEVSNELNEADFENKKTIEPKKGCSKGGYKAISLAIALSALFAGSIIIKDINNKNKIDGEVVSLKELETISKEVVNVKQYLKEGSSIVEDIGEYGGGSVYLDNGKYLNYSFYPNDGVVVEIYNEDNSLMFKTKIKQEDDKDVYINDAKITKDNNILISVGYENNSKESYSKIIKFNLEGEALSELVLEEYADVIAIDNLNNMIVYNYFEDDNCKIIKYDNNNKKIFEYDLITEGRLTNLFRLFTDEDKTILFTTSFKNDWDFNGTIGYCILNEKGEEIFKKEDTGYSLENISNVIQTSTGDFLIEEVEPIKYSNDYICKLKSIVKVDSKLNEIWKEEVNKTISDSRLIELNNEYILYMNEVYSVKDVKAQSKVSSLTKINSSGEKVWSKYLDYDKNKEFNIINNSEIDRDIDLYTLNDNLIIKATIFDKNMSQGYVKLTVDRNGNIS